MKNQEQLRVVRMSEDRSKCEDSGIGVKDHQQQSNSTKGLSLVPTLSHVGGFCSKE